MLKSALLGLAVIIGGWIVGGVLIATDHTLLGIIIGCAAIPVAFVVWLGAATRM